MISQYSLNETCFLEKIKFIQHGIFSKNTDTLKFLSENIKCDTIITNNSLDKAYETFRFIVSDLYDKAFPKREIETKFEQFYNRKQRLYE